MFKITGGKGFHLTFENGYTLSTQFGYGNYCENYNNQKVCKKCQERALGVDVESSNCEIAIWGKGEEWATQEILEKIGDFDVSGDVQGYVTFQ